MNYRHAFHAGNFADLVKHAALLRLLERLGAGPLTVIDTHAGRGLYDLAGPEARRSGEAEAGVMRLMAAKPTPHVFDPLVRAVAALNGGRDVLRYPGSPWLIAEHLPPQGRYLACELRKEEHRVLNGLMKARANVQTLCADGFRAAIEHCPSKGRVLILIDPPFERPDDYGQIVETLQGARNRNPDVQALVWLPLKDLETFDGFLRDLEDGLAAPLLVAEARVRPLEDPMKMNGCALVVVNGPDLSTDLSRICGWVAETLGEGGAARVYALQ